MWAPNIVPMTAPPTLGQPGDRLGVWCLDRPLAPAPSGHWWRASHSKSGQAVLVLLYADPHDAGAVLLRMAGSVGQPWNHPDIAWPLDSGVNALNQPYVVMPCLGGQPLVAALGDASLRRRLEWVMQLCELLLLAQQEGLSLVELDPSLLWVGPQQQLRLHGLALVPEHADALQMGSLQGHIARAAQALQSPQAVPGAAGTPADQAYRVGRLMAWLVTGRWGTDGHEASSLAPSQTLLQWLTLRDEAREALGDLLRRTAAEAPAERPADLVVLGEAIESWLDDAGSVGSGAVPLDALPSSSPAPAPAPAPRLSPAPTELADPPSGRGASTRPRAPSRSRSGSRSTRRPPAPPAFEPSSEVARRIGLALALIVGAAALVAGLWSWWR